MKLIIFAALFMVLLAAGISARGLEITDMRMSVEYSEAYTYQLEFNQRASYAPGLTNNSRIKADVFPGDNVTFTVRMENALRGSGPENRMRNAFVKVTIKGIDGGSDIDQESDNYELEGGDDTLTDLKFPLPFDAATGTYDVLVDAQSDGRNGTFYFTENKLKLEVKKLSHDIRITKSQLNPAILDCATRKTRISAEIMNLGSNDESEMALEFKSNELGINSIDRSIQLISSNDANDDEKKYIKALPIEISPNMEARIYPVFVNLYWKGSILFDQKRMYLDIRNCGSSGIQNQTTQNANQDSQNIPYTQNQQTQALSNNGSVNYLLQNISISGSPALIWIILGAFAVFIVVIVVIFGYVRKSGL